uniref:Translational activator of cytochrome c oxidase 1 n=2 Tax=Caenorhabditis japonica TaxID=281687 RepID=A0A8R1E8C0_CAEJA
MIMFRRFGNLGAQVTKYQRNISLTASNCKGHSKWQNIKATKGKNDLIRSKATNYLLRKVKGAVSRGGFDLKLNRELVDVEQEFRAQGLPLDTFKSFLQKLKEKPEIEYTFDIIGPSGIFLIITAESSNKKSLENDLRKYFNKLGGFRLAADGGVRSWFEEKGVTHVSASKAGSEITMEEMEEAALELEVEEVTLFVEDSAKKFELLCESNNLLLVENGLSKQGFSVLSSEIEFRAVHPITLSEADARRLENLYDMLQVRTKLSNKKKVHAFSTHIFYFP